MSKKCARCDKTVYPIEELKCLDKTWHKACFKCNECAMILNMKTYKGFNKQPYCNAHCPVARATTVVDTPETRRLAENTKIQSQVKYHEDFEKQKGKLTQVADDPETLRIRNTSKIISNVSYHGDYEKKKQMEERRNLLENENNNVTQFSPILTEKTLRNAPSYDYASNNNAPPVAKNANSTTTDYYQRNQHISYGNNGNPVEQNRADYYKPNNALGTKIPTTGSLNQNVQNVNYMKDARYINPQVPPQMVTQQQYLLQQQQQQSQYLQQQKHPHQPIYHDNPYYSGGMPIQNSRATNLGRCFRAIYDYNSQDNDEVSFLDGDLIINCQPIDDGWMTGTVQRTGHTGMLPSNYVESA